MNKEFKELKRDNEKIRKEIGEILKPFAFTKSSEKYFWVLVNDLIDNELKLEEACNQ